MDNNHVVRQNTHNGGSVCIESFTEDDDRVGGDEDENDQGELI